MKILLISSEKEDYLQDAIIHGFKELLGENAIEFPIKPMLYNDFNEISSIRGNGFTLYGLIDAKKKTDRILNIKEAIINEMFDRIVFTSIHRQYSLFYKLYPLLKRQKERVWVIDGEDFESLFPYFGRKFIKFFFFPKPHKFFRYFKRELVPGSKKLSGYSLLLSCFLSDIADHDNIRQISFAIPQEKIVNSIPFKKKIFCEHVVDSEVAEKLLRKSTNHVFSSEKAYYNDIQDSKFGITTKRAGWDCLRHYEIAANGAVICFKDLNMKPYSCAPHGLIDGYNCISYCDYDDLMKRIDELSEVNYLQMLSNSLNWIRYNTTIERVRQMLKDGDI